MSDMNITQEQIQAAMANGGGFDLPQTENPVISVIEAATESGVVRNVVRVTDGEMRCVISNNGVIKPTTIIDGGSTQEYNPEEDIITWITILSNDRQILKQDKNGIHPMALDVLGEIYGTKVGYVLSYLSSFGGDNNILLDVEKVKKFEEASVYAEELIGESDQGLKTLIASMCTKTEDFRAICQTWDQAEIFDTSGEELVTIEWGCRAVTEAAYVKYDTTYVILWAKPMVLNTDGEEVPDQLLQVVTRQVNPDNVPHLGPDSIANFTVVETLNNQIAAYAEVTENTLDRRLTSIKLFKTADFDITKSSF